MLLWNLVLAIVVVLLCMAGTQPQSTQPDLVDVVVDVDGTIATIEQLLNYGGRGGECWERIQALPAGIKEAPMMEFLAARALAQLGNWQQSERKLLNLLAVEIPEDLRIKASKLLAKIYLQQKRWLEAERLVEKVLHLSATDYEGLLIMARIVLGKDTDKEKALQLLDKAIQVNSNGEQAHFDRAVVLLELRDVVRAKAAFSEAKRLNPSLDSGVVGNLYLQFGHLEYAEQALQEAVSTNYETQVGLLLAQTKEALGKLEQAKHLYTRVVADDPNNAVAHAGIGLLLLGIGNYNYGSSLACGLHQEEALIHLRVANRLDPNIRPVTEAIDNCRKEFEEANKWRNITKSIKKDSNAIQPMSISNVMDQLFRPIRNIRKHLFKSFKNILSGPCSKTTNPLLSTFCDSLQSADSDLLYKQYPSKVAKKIKKMEKHWKTRTKTIRNSLHEIDWPGIKVFYQKYIKVNAPVVIRGFQSSWKHSNFSNADLFMKYAEKSFGKNIVKVSVSPTGRFDGPESGRLWGLDEKIDILVRPPTTSMLFADFLSLTKSNLDETLYLEYLSTHQYLGKEFEQQFAYPFNHQIVGMKHLVTNAWIAASPTTSPLHYDDYENFLCQVFGEKELILFPPGDLPYLYYQGRSKGNLNYQFPNTFHRDVESIERRKVVFGSSILIDNPDAVKYPLYRYATPIRVVLKPGQCLYLPPFWHHEVQSLPDPIAKVNFAVNFWFQNVTYPVDEHSLLNTKK